MDKKEVLNLLYEELKRIGRLDKEGVLRILGLEYTNWNMRKALNYLKDLANEFKDVELKQGKKGAYYVEWVKYKEIIKDNLKKSFNFEEFENEFLDAVYYVGVDKIIDGVDYDYYAVIEAIEYKDFKRIWEKYKLGVVGDWINLRMERYDFTCVEMEYLKMGLTYNRMSLFVKYVEIPKGDNSIKINTSKVSCRWCSAKKGDIRYYNLIKGNDILYIFEVDRRRLYNSETGEIFLPSRILVYDLKKIDFNTIYQELKGPKKECRNLIYVVGDYDKRFNKSEVLAKLKLLEIVEDNKGEVL